MRVLVVEDYTPVRNAVSKGLRDAGFAVDTADDGEIGLWQAESGEHDVIILDLMLPKIDGLQILKQIRDQGVSSQVLILTAKDSIEDRVQGLNFGADDYLTKPFAFAELLARVRAMVRRRYQEPNPVIRIGDLGVNTSAREVRRGEKLIELTAREYSLLEFLALRQGQVVTRTDVWEHVYEFNSDTQSNVVDVYIGYLRKKIEQPGLPKLIHTRRGHGYVLKEAT